MNLIEIAQIYTDLVNADDGNEKIGELRSKYHQILMDKLREEGIEFHDRFEAMNYAFELVKSQTQTPA